MSSFFQKVGQGSGKMFNKVSNNPNFFSKFSNTARKIDNSIARVGNFLQPTLNMVNPALGGMVQQCVNAVHQIRNNLEKSITAPMRQIRNTHI